MTEVITTGLLEDDTTAGAVPAWVKIQAHGSRTKISVDGLSGTGSGVISLSVGTADILKAIQVDQMDDGR